LGLSFFDLLPQSFSLLNLSDHWPMATSSSFVSMPLKSPYMAQEWCEG